MADPSDLTQEIEDAASSPQSVRTTAASVDARPIKDLIAADQYLATKAAAARKSRGLRFTKLVGPQQCPSQGRIDLTNPDFGSFG